MRRHPLRPRAVLGGVAAVAALGAVFLLYLQPQLIFTLASQVWACF